MTKRLLWLALPLAGLLATGCQTDTQCETNSDCGNGQVCQANTCVTPGTDAGTDAGTDDTDAGTDAGETSACAAECTGATPVCNEDTGACVTCLADSDCGENGVCDTSVTGGACVACLEDEHCGPSLLCDTSGDENACVECVSNEQCGGDEPVCSEGACTVRPASEVSAEIQAVITEATGEKTGLTLPVNGALVTYIRPEVGSDPAGFFLQAEQQGPALFVAVDPATLGLDPALAVGDRLNLDVTAVNVNRAHTRATAVANLARTSQGNPVEPLIQNVSEATNVVTALDDYTHELLKASGTALTNFSGAGPGSLAVDFGTAGIPDAAGGDFEVRIPMTLAAELNFTEGCTFTVTGPMWRFDDRPQLSGFVASDFSAITCPAPTVVEANALSATTVVVTFDRGLAAGSVQADGSQFSITDGTNTVAVSAATLGEDGRTVTLTTADQTVAAAYTVTAATTLQDTYGTALAEDDRSATFTGFIPLATLVINEANPNIGSASGGDMVELRALTAGSIDGIKLMQYGTSSPTTLVTLPATVVAADDLIVVHFNSSGSPAETTSKNQHASTGYYDTAWDVTASSGMSVNPRVLTLETAAGDLQDAVPFVATADPGPTFYEQLTAIQTAGHWGPANCGGEPCGAATTPTASDISVPWNGLASNGTTSVARTATTAPDVKANFAQGVATWGLPNIVIP